MSGDQRTLLADASVLITLADIGELDALCALAGTVAVPETLRDEVVDDPAKSALETAIDDGALAVDTQDDLDDAFELAATHLGEDDGRAFGDGSWSGDVALLAGALHRADAVVVTDDKPLRQTCKALSIPVSGSIGVLVRAVERGALEPAEAKDALVAMDEVGARLSARLLRRAERLVDDAVED